MKKNRKKKDKIMLLNTMKVFIYKAITDSYISHTGFASVNNLFREYNEMKEEIKNPENSVECTI